MSGDNKLGSVVVPCFNEEGNVLPYYDALTAATDEHDIIGEIIFVDDGSTDRTFEVVCSLARKDPRVKCLRFSRNFGSHAAVTAGLRRATGSFAILMAVDLQDPPELIPELVRGWRDGFHVVWAVRRSREESFAKIASASLFYKLLRRLALPDYPPQGMDFGLLDRRVLDVFSNIRELHAFVPGTLVWMGFSQAQVPYDRRHRRSGTTKWKISRQFKTAFDAIISFSALPIRLTWFLGCLLVLMGALYSVFLLVAHLSGTEVSGWKAIASMLVMLEGVQLVMLGMLGEYVWRGFEQVKSRPPFIIMDEIGFSQPRG